MPCTQVPDVGPLEGLEVTRQGPLEGPRDGWLLQDVTVQPLHEDGQADGPLVFFHAMAWLGGGNASSVSLQPGVCSCFSLHSVAANGWAVNQHVHFC